MGDVLSQEEVESLLSDAKSTGASHSPTPRPGEPAASPPPRPREKITPYDFKRPERVGKEQMRALQTCTKGLAATLAPACRPCCDRSSR